MIKAGYRVTRDSGRDMNYYFVKEGRSPLVFMVNETIRPSQGSNEDADVRPEAEPTAPMSQACVWCVFTKK